MIKSQLKRNLRKAIIATCTAAGIFGAITAIPTVGFTAPYMIQQEQAITILPINQAKFIAGQKFDFLVEVKDAVNQTIEVTIDGQPAEAFFGKSAVVSMDGTMAKYRIDQVSMKKAGNAEITVKANNQKRTDETNVVEEFKALGYDISTTKSELAKTSKDADKLLGLYQLDNMDVYIDRAMLKNPEVLKGFDDQPGLVEMTDKAIEALSKNKNGFFLMVEGACVDKQLHSMDWQRAAYDNIEFDKAVGKAKEFASKNEDTLIIVVADHAHGASITGTYHELDGKTGREAVRTYAQAGFPTFEDRDGDGYPDNPNPDVTLAVQFANHPDAYIDYKFKDTPQSPAIMADGKAIANPKGKGEFYTGNIPSDETSEVHSADDVVLNADGPGAEYFKGVMDNTEIFFGMVRALGLDGTKNSK